MQFQNLLVPKTLADACRYAAMPNTVVLGGGMWVRMQKRSYENAVDLSALGLDKIIETKDGILIGAYVSLRDLETSPLMLAYTKTAVKTALAPIVGVQFRNGATVGGSIFGRFGFSDVCTLFSALGAEVLLAEKGKMPIGAFMESGAPHDVLTHILLPKEKPDACVCLSHRESATDFPVVTVAAVRRNEEITLSASPAPVRALAKTYPGALASVSDFMAALPLKENSSDSILYRDRLMRVLLGRALGGVK